MGDRRRGREHALQLLFQLDLAGGDPDEVFRRFWKESALDEPGARSFAEALVTGVHEHRRQLDRLILGSARNWKIERMAVVDRAVLRMATYELLSEADTPGPVVIDEAIEIAKKFGGAESGAFVNGIMDALHRRIQNGQIRPWSGEHDDRTSAPTAES